jgi:hypothetical protein
MPEPAPGSNANISPDVYPNVYCNFHPDVYPDASRVLHCVEE